MNIKFKATVFVLWVFSGLSGTIVQADDALSLSSFSPNLPSSLQARVQQKIQYCGWCHGTTGAQAYSTAPEIAGQLPEYFAEQIRNFKDHSRNSPNSLLMWSVAKDLDDDVAPYVIDYFSHQKLSNSGCQFPWYDNCSNKKLAAKGEAIFMNGIAERNVVACQYCHGADAMGIDPVPRLATQRPYYISNQLHAFRDGLRAKDVAMPEEVKNLTDDEIEQLANYVGSL